MLKEQIQVGDNEYITCLLTAEGDEHFGVHSGNNTFTGSWLIRFLELIQ